MIFPEKVLVIKKIIVPLHPLTSKMAGELSWLERRIHNPEVEGSGPPPATE